MMMENIMLEQVLGSALLRKLQAMEDHSASDVHNYHQQAGASNNYIGTPNPSLSDIHIHDDALLAKQEVLYQPMSHDTQLLPSSPPPPLPSQQDAVVIDYLLSNPRFSNMISCKQEQREEKEALVNSLPSYDSAALLGPRHSLLRTSENHDFGNSAYSSYHSHSPYDHTPLMHFVPRDSGRYNLLCSSNSYNITTLAEHVQYPSPGSGRYSSEPSHSYTHLASEDLSLIKDSMQDEANCLNIEVLHTNLAEVNRDALSCSLSCMTNANNPHSLALSTSSSSTPTSGLTLAKENLQTWIAFDEHYNSSRDLHIHDKHSTLPDMNNNMVDGDQKNVISSSMPSHEKKKRRKRKRTSHKNVEEMECQRMTHIAVERNRRKQMNEHLRALRLLMPHSYIQRGDQASIVGGTIRFVEELEQVLQSLRLQKQLRSHCVKFEDNFGPCVGFMEEHMESHIEESYASTRSCLANVEVIMLSSSTIFTKVLTQKRPHQLLHTLLALTNLSLRIVHLNVTTIELIILYSFNLEMGDDCQLHTPTELAESILHIFSM